MIHLCGVTDRPHIFGVTQTLLSDVNFVMPQGRYALLSRNPEFHKPLIDVIGGLRPPRQGFVSHDGLVSWSIGRQGLVRSKATGFRMIQFVSSLYGMNARLCSDLVGDLITSPEYLSRPMEHWPIYVRQEFSFALALAPSFDVYLVEGALPFEPCRFTNLWLALFEERLVGRTLLLSTYRHQQMTDYCTKGLVYEQQVFRIEDDLEQCIREYPPRRSREASGDTPDESGSTIAGNQFDF